MCYEIKRLRRKTIIEFDVINNFLKINSVLYLIQLRINLEIALSGQFLIKSGRIFNELKLISA